MQDVCGPIAYLKSTIFLSRIYYSVGKRDIARALIDKAETIKLESQIPNFVFETGVIFIEGGEYELALKLLKFNGKFEANYAYETVFCLYRLNDYDECIRIISTKIGNDSIQSADCLRIAA